MHIACTHCGSTNRVPDQRLADDPVCGRCGQVYWRGTHHARMRGFVDEVLAAAGRDGDNETGLAPALPRQS